MEVYSWRIKEIRTWRKEKEIVDKIVIVEKCERWWV